MVCEIKLVEHIWKLVPSIVQVQPELETEISSFTELMARSEDTATALQAKEALDFDDDTLKGAVNNVNTAGKLYWMINVLSFDVKTKN